MKNLLGISLILLSMVIFGLRISKKVVFEQNVTGYLKRAADANTIDLAKEELSKAITYLEEKNLTTGYTSIFWQTPDEDIDFWYRNLKASQKELQDLQAESSLERTNMLLKLRETLLDGGEKERVTAPDGLGVYPNNKLWAGLMLLSVVALMVGIGMLLPTETKKE